VRCIPGAADPLYVPHQLSGCVQASYANLVDQTGGFDGWMATGLPVEQ
jgi:hypothetical protein